MSVGICVIISGPKLLIFRWPFDALKATPKDGWIITNGNVLSINTTKRQHKQRSRLTTLPQIITVGVSFGGIKFRQQMQRRFLVIMCNGIFQLVQLRGFLLLAQSPLFYFPHLFLPSTSLFLQLLLSGVAPFMLIQLCQHHSWGQSLSQPTLYYL